MKSPHLGRVQRNVLEELAEFGATSALNLLPRHGTYNQRRDVLRKLEDRGFIDDLDTFYTDPRTGDTAREYRINNKGYAALKFYGRLPRIRREAIIG